MGNTEILTRNVARAGVAALCLSVLTACATIAPAPAPGARGAVQEARPNTARGAATAAEDPNITQAGGANVADVAGEAPPAAKAPEGTAARGASSCMVHFDNRSRLYINTYADGTYRGNLGPWGDIYTYVIAGPTRLYARADFTNSPSSTWGPTMVSCPAGGSFTWRLYW